MHRPPQFNGLHHTTFAHSACRRLTDPRATHPSCSSRATNAAAADIPLACGGAAIQPRSAKLCPTTGDASNAKSAKSVGTKAMMLSSCSATVATAVGISTACLLLSRNLPRANGTARRAKQAISTSNGLSQHTRYPQAWPLQLCNLAQRDTRPVKRCASQVPADQASLLIQTGASTRSSQPTPLCTKARRRSCLQAPTSPSWTRSKTVCLARPALFSTSLLAHHGHPGRPSKMVSCLQH